MRRALRAWLATTPGRLIALLAALLVVCAAFGVATVWTASSHAGAAQDVARTDQRLSGDARQIYGSLANADTTASSAYLAGGVEPAALRQRYLNDIASANGALTEAAKAAGDDSGVAGPIGMLSDQIPVYTGVVETARADNRLGLPIGGAYLGEASAVMHGRLLPAADQLFGAETARLGSHQNDAGAFAYPAVFVGLIVLALLVVAQVWLTRRTRRMFNPGLLGSTAAIVVALIWLVAALTLQHDNIGKSRQQGSAQIESLAQAETSALRAHGDESLFLITGGEDLSYSGDYAKSAAKLDQELKQAANIATPADSAVASAQTASAGGQAAHARMTAANAAGQYSTAVHSVTAGDTATRFTALHDVIDSAIKTDQSAFTRYAKASRTDVDGLSPVMAVLALLAAAGCVVGIGARLREYW